MTRSRTGPYSYSGLEQHGNFQIAFVTGYIEVANLQVGPEHLLEFEFFSRLQRLIPWAKNPALKSKIYGIILIELATPVG